MIQEGKYQEVFNLAKEELELPYVPLDAMHSLEKIEQECLENTDEPIVSSSIELSQLCEGNELQKEKAVNLLKATNLRMHEAEVQKLLDSSLLDEFKGELIEALMEQKIDTPYRIKKEGLEITFVPSLIVSSQDDPTMQSVRSLFEMWFSNDDPSMLAFCVRLLEQERYEMLPYDMSDLDPLVLAKNIVRLVYEAMSQEDALAQFYEKNGLEKVENTTLFIEKRGESYEK